ncbi:hypothetical protein CC86DRAFT_452454 [Ophiobolus disseminans]|uniref:DUF7730 domain-containing protein n=1 Tax=Ophiobolus disseminans TaxID=1469910 RepID=A0A6A7AFB4_9PLEO|nr:hypothetical protein CC86DRAFT_452454 [Ophiobolus disseminans]
MSDWGIHDAFTAITQRNQLASPLLRLPAELRNKIYFHIFGGKYISIWFRFNERYELENPVVCRGYISPLDAPGPVTSSRKDPRPAHFEYHENKTIDGILSHTFALLKVCRQINIEACLLPLNLNVFNIPNMQVLDRWIDTLGPKIAAVRTVRMYHRTLKYYKRENDEAMKRLRSFTGLRRLEVWVEHDRVAEKLEVVECKNSQPSSTPLFTLRHTETTKPDMQTHQLTPPRPPAVGTASPLLLLPPELRNEIYGYVFSGRRILVCTHAQPRQEYYADIYSLPSSVPFASSVDLPMISCDNRGNFKKKSHTFALLKVCRQINTEARLLPWDLSAIQFSNTSTVALWLETVGPEVVGKVRSIITFTRNARGTADYTAGYLITRMQEFSALKWVGVKVLEIRDFDENVMQDLVDLKRRMKEVAGDALEVVVHWS